MGCRKNPNTTALWRLSLGFAFAASATHALAQSGLTIGGLLDEGAALYRDNGGHWRLPTRGSTGWRAASVTNSRRI